MTAGSPAAAPAAAQQLLGQQTAAADAAAAHLSVGQVKQPVNCIQIPHLKAALNLWAGCCYPGQPADAVRVADLLQHSSRFVSHIMQRVTCTSVATKRLAADTGERYLRAVRSWLSREPQLLAGMERSRAHSLTAELDLAINALCKGPCRSARQHRLDAAAAAAAPRPALPGAEVVRVRRASCRAAAASCLPSPGTLGVRSSMRSVTGSQYSRPLPLQLQLRAAPSGQQSMSAGGTDKQALHPVPGPDTTFADLQQALPPARSTALALLWDVAQDPDLHGPDADRAAVKVSPLLLLWGDPQTQQDCRDSFQAGAASSADGQEHLAATLELLDRLQQLLAQPVLQHVVGGKEQQ